MTTAIASVLAVAVLHITRQWMEGIFTAADILGLNCLWKMLHLSASDAI